MGPKKRQETSEMNPELVAKARQRVEEPKVVETATGRLVHVPTVLNLPEASRLASDGYPAILTAGPTRDELSWSIDCMHVEEFLDVESNVPGGPNAEALERAIDFGARCDGPLVIHCHAGISRSTATAIAVLIARGVSPEVALQTMSSDHSHDRRFMPNRLVLQIAGELLGYRTLPFDVAPYEHSVDGSHRSPWTPVEM